MWTTRIIWTFALYTNKLCVKLIPFSYPFLIQTVFDHFHTFTLTLSGFISTNHSLCLHFAHSRYLFCEMWLLWNIVPLFWKKMNGKVDFEKINLCKTVKLVFCDFIFTKIHFAVWQRFILLCLLYFSKSRHLTIHGWYKFKSLWFLCVENVWLISITLTSVARRHFDWTAWGIAS